MKPNDGFFNLSATTDAGVQVDLKVELLSKTGEVLWNKSFKAPFTTLITDKITTLGATMRFSIPDAGKNVITQLNTYPNPAKGQLYLQVKSVEIVTNAELSISTLLGQNILNRKINLPFNQPINLSNIKPGMYVMKIVTGKEVISKVIKIE
jgi:hypothetical protein